MNSNEQRVRATRLRDLHQGPGILVLPNAWDCTSARLFEEAGFPAIATTSGGVAAVLGYADGQHVSAGEMLLLVGRIAETVAVPVTADLEAGYGQSAGEIAEVMRQAISAGVVGVNLEDGRGAGRPLAKTADQAEIIGAVREVALSAGIPLVINARVDVFLRAAPGDPAGLLDQAVERARAYCGAGADSIFPIGLRDCETISRFVRDVGCPVNIMAGHGAPAIAELERIGVRRVTFGSAMMRATLPLVWSMAKDMRARGESSPLEQGDFTHAAVNALFNRK
ncbi:MAG: isocitrate lyase/phosphoenolpyruvate mutase family protein [Opitutaceae bacterium]|nr:isocitrate lyase/phosphoenolpyruvate mutase family protein [Opitutaceae bacterium]